MGAHMHSSVLVERDYVSLATFPIMTRTYDDEFIFGGTHGISTSLNR